MKRLFAVILICLFCATGAFAAEWGEGLGPDQPLPGVRKLNLNREMGYSYTYPRPGLEAKHFCNVLEIYLPREDITLGEGHAHLYDSTGEILDIDFANPDQVQLRVQHENELIAKKWGSGVCIEIYLPMSLKLNESYYVLMDMNCFNAGNRKISNYDLTKPDQWTPLVTGDYGISGLYYCAPAAPEAAEEGGRPANAAEAAEAAEATEATEATEAEAQDSAEATAGEPKYNPTAGDEIHFDLVLGGDAKTAVVYSDNESALFPIMSFTESGHVTGSVAKDALDWGVVFLGENNEVVQIIKPAWLAPEIEPEVEPEAGPGTGQETEPEAGQEAEPEVSQEAEPEAGQEAEQAE